MKKVLIIQQIIPDYRKEFFNLLKQELVKNDIELVLIHGEKENKLLDWAIPIANKKINFLKVDLRWQPLLKYIKNKDLIIVEAANKLILNYVIIILRSFNKTKLGFWGHGRNMQAHQDSWRNKFSLLFLKKCDWWFGYTTGVRDFLIKNAYPANQITVVQNAIDTGRLRKQLREIKDSDVSELRNQLKITSNKVALFCGGMYLEKRIDFILETCYQVKKEIPEFEMIFIGVGEESVKVEKAAENNCWIHYVGSKKGKDRIKYFKIASIQLMPESVGLGILDSFALETPIITTQGEFHGPEIEYLENGINGIITEDSLKEYSQTIIRILKTAQHTNLLKGCIASANKYTVQQMVENFKNGIINCINREPASANL